MNQWINLKCTCALLLIPLLLVCFGLAPMAQAVGPDTDGTIPGSNNGEGIGVLVSRTVGVWNTGTGFEALNHLTAGNQKTATGLRALTSDTNGGYNTATGVFSLFSNTSGFFNSATGAYSLANNISGNYNTANGYAALYRNTASFNTATGFGALYKNTTGLSNTANGFQALNRNTTGVQNTANGYVALFNNTTGNNNTANGSQALYNNTTGVNNTATGFGALYFNTGDNNTATGFQALNSNTTGLGNTATGVQALYNTIVSLNTANGYFALYNNTTGISNIALGAGAGNGVTTANHVICIGTNFPGENVSNSCYIDSIFGQTSSGGTGVVINSSGKLGTMTSSRRFKEEIKPMERASEALFALKPVTFRYKKGIDPQGTPQFGLLAEDVEAVDPDLVVRDKEGKVNTVRYEAVNAMLLNEFLKEHRKVEEQQVRVTELNSRVAKQEALAAQQENSFQSKLAEQDKQIEALTSGLEKVSAHLEVTKSAPQVVSNNL